MKSSFLIFFEPSKTISNNFYLSITFLALPSWRICSFFSSQQFQEETLHYSGPVSHKSVCFKDQLLYHWLSFSVLKSQKTSHFAQTIFPETTYTDLLTEFSEGCWLKHESTSIFTISNLTISTNVWATLSVPSYSLLICSILQRGLWQ